MILRELPFFCLLVCSVRASSGTGDKFLRTFREEEGGDLWTYGDHLIVFADSSDIYSVSGYSQLYDDLTEVAETLDGTASTIFISSEQTHALEYFGVKEEELPKVLMLHLEYEGAVRMRQYNIRETCSPFCKVNVYQGDNEDLDRDALMQFAEAHVKAREGVTSRKPTKQPSVVEEDKDKDKDKDEDEDEDKDEGEDEGEEEEEEEEEEDDNNAEMVSSSVVRWKVSDGGEVWKTGSTLVLFSDAKTYTGKTQVYKDFVSVSDSFGEGLANALLISPKETAALTYFGMDPAELPALMMVRLEPPGAQRMQQHNIKETCMPFCKAHKYGGGQLSEGTMRKFAEQHVKKGDRRGKQVNEKKETKQESAPKTAAKAPTSGLFALNSNYRYVKFTPTELRANSSPKKMIQMSEFEFYDGDEVVRVQAVENPKGDNPVNEDAASLVDSNLYTKWLDKGDGVLIFDLGSPTPVDGYRWATGFDQPGRDPVKWTMEGSDDVIDYAQAPAGGWTMLQTEAIDQKVEPPRHAWVGSGGAAGAGEATGGGANTLNQHRDRAARAETMCPVGTYIQNHKARGEKQRCAHCPTGYFQPKAEAEGCQACSPGKYQKRTKQVGCTECPAGKFAKRAKSAKCSECPAGKFAKRAKSDKCRDCPEGKFAFEVGSSACVEDTVPELKPLKNHKQSRGEDDAYDEL